MLEKGLAADPAVYNYLMLGLVKNEDGDRALALFKELKEKLEFVNDGIVYGNLMKAYFLKGLDKEAMEIYADLLGEGSSVKMNVLAYNSALQAMIKNGKSDEALQLFERMKEEHGPPRKLTVNLGSYNVMVDWFCEQGKFDDAIEVFRRWVRRDAVHLSTI
ncbi:hypothetical protein IFM89_019078 [Coptis chinensis]|uniref:Pentatricopeptide repeat-containing protein n=1 Tax=Coptis chinensis TaxID=261450 RepID=A0A835LVV0_9MAGN|nr:hypothetical protein IFM89_019078 [Coptis chinensis]